MKMSSVGELRIIATEWKDKNKNKKHFFQEQTDKGEAEFLMIIWNSMANWMKSLKYKIKSLNLKFSSSLFFTEKSCCERVARN